MKWRLTAIVTVLTTSTLFAQQTLYDVTAGNGNGIRFWQSNEFKIHMGNLSEYKYGPVTDYSIKMNMSADVGRGWTWGTTGLTPVAALSNIGNMQIAGKMMAPSFSVGMALDSKKIALWDDLNNWYGLGIQGGQIRFQVGNGGRFSFFQGDNAEVFTVKGSGEVGIGTTSPGSALSVKGRVGIRADAAPTAPVEALRVEGAMTLEENVANVTNLADQDFIVRLSGAGAVTKRTIIGPSVVNRFSLGVGLGSGNANEYLTIINGGNVGIGTTNPNQKLTVNGTIYGKEVKVDLSVPGPDYVFDKDYQLTSLEDIKAYIDQNKHLPEVPSALEMEANGINLSEMNMILLKKVEELTLYVIEQNKKLQNQEMEVVDLKMKVVELINKTQK